MLITTGAVVVAEVAGVMVSGRHRDTGRTDGGEGFSGHHESLLILSLVTLFLANVTAGAADLGVSYAPHSQGNIQLVVGPCSWGHIQRNISGGGGLAPYDDPFTGNRIYGCTYPSGSGNLYLDGGLDMGAVRGKDTITMILPWGWGAGCRTSPCTWEGYWDYKTIDQSKYYYSDSARSELDLTIEVLDTVEGEFPTFFCDPYSPWEPTYHRALKVVGTQRSMAWSGALTDDFVLLDYEFLNVGDAPLKDLYVSMYLSGYAFRDEYLDDVEDDALTGFLRGAHIPELCNQYDTLNIAYIMDNDGDPAGGRFPAGSRRGAVGVMLLGSSAGELQTGYYWIHITSDCTGDWGPRQRSIGGEPFRSFSPYFIWPNGDRNYYYLMSHPTIAYDQMFAAVSHESQGWLPPGPFHSEIASGAPVHAYCTFGPFQVPVHERFSFTIAVVGGDNVHTDPTAHFQPEFPEDYYQTLDFSELIENARWAKKVYDIPGFDSNNDGYRGEYVLCDGDTAWLCGDGVPDFKANSPPPAPVTRYITERNRITVRWNGYISETAVDPFTGLVDFEGYRVYSGLDDRRGSLSLLTSYDRLNFKRLWWRTVAEGTGRWQADEPPFSLDSLKELYGNDFNPLSFPMTHPLVQGDSACYFEPVSHNQYSLTDPHGIHKVYPDAIDPGTDSTLWTDDDITLEHGQPLPKYYEYEYVYDGILPTVAYFMSVTSMDYGFTGSNSTMPPQESNPLNNITEAYALPSTDEVEAQKLDVIVYPNPYRVDAHYEDNGFENRKGVIIPDRARLIHFANLPNVCKISIFSLDGDLVGTVRHNFPNGGPEAMHDWWDLSTRSGLTVTSGLYYWVVESNTRTQIGKLVILK